MITANIRDVDYSENLRFYLVNQVIEDLLLLHRLV